MKPLTFLTVALTLFVGAISLAGAKADSTLAVADGCDSLQLDVERMPLVPGGSATIDLTGTSPAANVLLVVSPFTAFLPFKGCVMVPDPSEGATLTFLADGLGELHLAGPVPQDLPPVTLHFQAFAGGGTQDAPVSSSNVEIVPVQ